MKKLFTLFCLVATVCVVSAQNKIYRPVDGNSLSKMKSAPSVTKKHFTQSQRSASNNLILDYDGVDNTYATNMGYDYQRYIWDLNRNFTNAEFGLSYAAVSFDTLLYVDQNSAITFYPRSSTTLTLDSFDTYFIHQNTTGNNDSIKFTVFNLAQKTVSGYGTPGAVFTTPSLWDTTIVTNVSTPLNVNNQFTVATFYPNLSFAQGQSFGIRVDYVGDTANHFQILAGYRDQCLAACQAEISAAGNNSAYYLNLTTQTGTNLSGYYENDGQGAIYYDCDQNNTFTPGGCENFPIQNIVMTPYVTANVSYGAVIVADSLKGCPNSQLNLTANAFGSSSTPYTYSWATSSGNLTSTSDPQVSLILGTSNATVSVTVTDANNQTTVATALVKSQGINVNIANTNPLQINCGGSATTVFTSISGVTTGKNYTWSTGATGSNQVSIQVSTPGNYTVTVTNNSGCSATASLTVQYPNGINNTVSFGPIPNPVCQSKEFTIPNTSSSKTGWTATWDFGDSNLGFTMDGTHTYTNPGVYPVKLSMDSAGCTFTSAPQNVTALAASNSACISSVNNVEFDNAISMLPNPTKGQVTITVNATDHNNLTIRIFNILGAEVINYQTANTGATFAKTFDMSSLANGTYLVKISSGDKTAIKRLTLTK